jgi:hypothetical protein
MTTFSSTGFDPERLRSRLPFFCDLDPANPDVWVHRKRDNLEAFVEYGDGTLHRVPAAMQRDLTRWAQSVGLAKLPALAFRRGLSPGGLER